MAYSRMPASIIGNNILNTSARKEQSEAATYV